MNTITPIQCQPNPVKNKLAIQGLKEGFEIGIYDVAGKKIFSGLADNPKMNIPLGSLESGVYFVQISDSGKTIFNKTITKA